MSVIRLLDDLSRKILEEDNVGSHPTLKKEKV